MFFWMFATWAGLTSAALLGPGDIFVINPVFSILRSTGVSEDIWGWIMLADAVFLGLCLLVLSRSFRSAVLLTSGAIWSFIGVLLVVGGYRVGVFSGSGAYSMVCALACWHQARTI